MELMPVQRDGEIRLRSGELLRLRRAAHFDDGSVLHPALADRRLSGRGVHRRPLERNVTLADLGHREIGIVTGSLGLRNARDRLSGYEEALQESGIGLDPELVREGDFRIEAGYRLSRDLLCRSRPPTALFVSNGMMTVGVLRTLREMALHCPEEVALAGFDDLPFSELIQPTLTSVAQPAYEIGYRGAELLIGRIEGTIQAVVPLEIKLEVELKVRQSSARSRIAAHT